MTTNTMYDDDGFSESSKTNPINMIFLRENINRFNEQLFQEYTKRLSRYNVERQWPGIIKASNGGVDANRLDGRDIASELSYWKYPGRKMLRAVSEPNLHTVQILGTAVLRKSNSFHGLCETESPDKRAPAESLFMPKCITWLYVTKTQCCNVNCTQTDNDLVKIFDDMFQWESLNEQMIMSRLLADVAKYCKKYDLSDEKMSTLLGIYCYTHLYNKSLDILGFEEVYNFFKELIIHHSVLNPPDHMYLFSTEEAKHILTHFLNKYIICLPLVRHICVQRTILRVHWTRTDLDHDI